MVTIRWRARFHPGQGTPWKASLHRTRWNASLHVRPAPPRSRSAWSAPACWRCGRAPLRPETYDPTPAFHKRPDGLLSRRHCPFEARFHPGPTVTIRLEGPVPPGPGDAVEGVPPVSFMEGRVSPRPVSRSSSEPPDCLHCRDPKRRLRSCAGYEMRPSRKIPKKVSVWRMCREALAISPGEVPAWLVWVSPMRPAGRLPEPHEAGTTAR